MTHALCVMEHAKLIESACTEYLSGLGIFDDAMLFLSGQDDAEKTGQRIVSYVTDLSEEPPFSGNRFSEVTVELRTPIATDGTDMLELHESEAAALEEAIMDDGLEASLSSADLLVYSVIERNAFRNTDESGYSSGWRLRLYSARAG